MNQYEELIAAVKDGGSAILELGQERGWSLELLAAVCSAVLEYLSETMKNEQSEANNNHNRRN